MIGVSLKLCQSLIISYFIFRVVSLTSNFTFIEVAYELGITIAAFIFNGGKSNVGYNILATISLTYLCLPGFGEKVRLISILYLLKYFHLRNNLRQLSQWFVSKNFIIPFPKYFNFFFNFLRYSVLEYLFIGFMIMNYKIWNMFDPEDIPLPQDHQLYYQYFVTASTIGYGDVTPKSRMQMIHFTLIIPIICGSFAVLLNHLSEVFTNCFLTQQTSKQSQKRLNTLMLGIVKNFLPKHEVNSLNEFIEKRRTRQQQDSNLIKALATEGIPNDEVIVAAYTYNKYKEFITKLYPQHKNDSKTLQTIASLVKTTYFPKGQTVLNTIEINDSVLYCVQGKITSQSHDASKTLINLDGFNQGKPSEKEYVAQTFVEIWSLSSSGMKSKFNEHFTWKISH